MLKDVIVLKIHVHLWSKKWAIFSGKRKGLYERENCFIVAPSVQIRIFLRAALPNTHTHFYELLREIAATLQFFSTLQVIFWDSALLYETAAAIILNTTPLYAN